MMKSETRIKLNQNLKNGDRLRFQLSYNGEPIEYVSGQNEIDKTFIEKISEQNLKIAETDMIGNLTNQSILGDFKGLEAVVNVVKRHEDYIIIGGRFNSYEHSTGNYDCKGIVILDKDTGVPIKLGSEYVHDFFQVNNGIVNDLSIRRNDGNVYLDIVGEFNNFKYKNINDVNTNATDDNFIEIDLSTFKCSVNWKQQWEGYTNVNDVILSCDVLGTNNQSLVFGGKFTQMESYNQSKVLKLNPNLTNNLQFRTNLGTVTGDIFKVLCHSEGGIFIGGDFNSVDNITSNKLAKLNIDGTVQYSPEFQFGFLTKINGGDVYDIIEDEFSVIFVGSFTSVNNISTPCIAKVNIFSGLVQDVFDTDIPSYATIKTIKKLPKVLDKIQAENNDIISTSKKVPKYVVGGDFRNNLTLVDFNAYIITQDAKYIHPIYLDKTVNDICTNGNTLMFGGEFSNYDNNSTLDDDEIEIGNSIIDTRNNLLSNLNQYNTYGTADYKTESIGTDEILITWEIQSITDIITLGNKIHNPPRLRVTFSLIGLDYDKLIVPLFLRSDNVFLSEKGDVDTWNNVDFKISGYAGDIGDFVNAQEIETVNKKRLTEEQLTQYLEIGQLLEKKNYNPTNYFNFNEDNFEIEEGFSLAIKPTDQIYLTAIEIISKIGDNPTLSNFNIGFVLDGFRRNRRDNTLTIKSRTEAPSKSLSDGIGTILNNGNYREVDDLFNLTFITTDIEKLRITDIASSETIDYNLQDIPNTSQYLVSQFELKPAFGKYLKVELIYDSVIESVVGTFFVKFKKNFCNQRYELLFKNSFGVLENLPIHNLNEEFKYKSNEYRGYIRDINGRYFTDEHTDKTYGKNATKTIKCNTGNISDRMNEQIEDLFMSEEIWLVDRNNSMELTPVKLKGNMELKTSYKDGIVNYDLTLEVDNDDNKFIL